MLKGASTVPVFVINGAVWDKIFRHKRRRFVPLSTSPYGLSHCRLYWASLLRLHSLYRSVRFVDSPRWVAVLWPFLLCLFGQFFSAFFLIVCWKYRAFLLSFLDISFLVSSKGFVNWTHVRFALPFVVAVFDFEAFITKKLEQQISEKN